MTFTSDAVEMGRSLEFFERPDSYGPFRINARHQMGVGCIDPRDEERQNLNIIVQTPGGAGGKGFDSALSLHAYDGTAFEIVRGLDYDRTLQRPTISTAHPGCAFMNGRVAVAQEIYNPSDFSVHILATFIARYGLKDSGIEENIERIQNSAGISLDAIEKVDPDVFLDEVNKMYPTHNNVAPMNGANKAGIYIFNHHPFVGLNRHKVHRGDNPLAVQAYHDSTRASISNLEGIVEMPKDLKGLRLAALLLRSVATSAVLIGDKPDVKILQVVPTAEGTQVEEYIR